MIKTNNLIKKYKLGKNNYFTALKGLNFEVNDEKMIAIMGESGSGKSTFMNLVSTLDTPTAGEVFFDSKQVNYKNERAKSKYRKLNIGFVFQNFNLISDINIVDNVCVAMEIAGSKKSERIKRATELLELVGLKDHLDKKPGTLSGGQKQRVAIARALANGPDLILADEPTGALDSTTSKEIMQLLKSISMTGKKVIIVTHDKKVASYCDRIVEMSDGKIIDDNKNEAAVLETIELPKEISKSRRGLGASGVFKLSWSAFTRRLKRNMLVSVGMGIAISSILLVAISTGSIKHFFVDLESKYGNDQVALIVPGTKDGSVVDTDAALAAIEKSNVLDDERIEKSYEIKVNPFNEAVVTAGEESTDAIAVNRMFPDDIETFGSEDIAYGTKPKVNNEVVVSEATAGLYGYEAKDAVGKTIQLFVAMPEQMPELREYKISGVLSESSYLDSSFLNIVYMKADEVSSYDDNTSYHYTLVLVEENMRDEFVTDAKTKFGNDDVLRFDISSHLSEIQMYLIMLDSVFIAFTIILGISVVVAMVMIAIMIYVSMLERMREIGVLRAIGAMKKDVRRMFYLEAIGIGIISGIMAIIIGISLSAVAINVMNNYFDFTKLGAPLTIYIQPLIIPIVFIVTLVLSIVSSIFSIALGLKITPVDALKK